MQGSVNQNQFFTDPCASNDQTFLDDASRNMNYGNTDEYCDCGLQRSPDWKGRGWYRIHESAGSMIPEHPVDGFHCNTDITGNMAEFFVEISESSLLMLTFLMFLSSVIK